jgi:hypothetical protein
LPYLKIKRRHAEIFLEFRKRIAGNRDYRRGKSNNATLPPEEYLARQKLIDEIHKLNKRTGKVQRRYSVETTQVNSKRNPDRLDAYNKTATSA